MLHFVPSLVLALVGSQTTTQQVDAGIRGRILLPNGAPAGGVHLVVDGFGSNDEAIAEHGLPWKWKPLEATTGPDGSFEFPFHPPQAMQMDMWAELPGYVSLYWNWFDLPYDRWTDVGDVHLEKGEVLTLEIVSPEGFNTDGQWQWLIRTSRIDLGHEADPVPLMGEGTCTDGVLRIPDLPPGELELTLFPASPGGQPIAETVRLEAGGGHQAVSYEGPALSGHAETPPDWIAVYTQGIEPLEELVLISAAGESIPPAEARFGGFVFRGLAAGEYAFEITDERFLPVSRSGIRLGERVGIELVGSSALQVLALDASSGEQIDGERLLFKWAGCEDTYCAWRPGERPSDSTLRGLVAGNFTLWVSAPGYVSERLEVESLAPREVRTIRVALKRTPTILGRLRDASGTGLAGIQVGLRGTDRAVRTRADGSFTLDALPEGDHVLEAVVAGAPVAELPVTVGSVEHITVDLRCAGVAWIEGRLAGVDRSHTRLLEVLVAHPGTSPAPWGQWIAARSKVDAEGGFRLGPLPCTPTALYLAVKHGQAESEDEREFSQVMLLVELADLLPGTTVLPDNLTTRTPGSLQVRAHVNGKPDPDLALVLQADFDPPLPEYLDMAIALRGRVGVFQFPTLLSGDWKLTVMAMWSGWTYEHPGRITIEPGAEARCDVDIALHRGRLLVLGAGTGEPLADHWIGFSVGGKTDFGHGRARVGRDGHIELELPPGEWTIWDLGVDGERRSRSPIRDGTVFEWPADGPQPPEVRVQYHDWR